MSIKIDAARGRYDGVGDYQPHRLGRKGKWRDQIMLRIVRESDWRRIVALVRAAERWESYEADAAGIAVRLVALRKHVEKRKERET